MYIINKETDERIVSRYIAGEEINNIAQTENLSKGTLYKILDKNNVPRRINKSKNNKKKCKNCGTYLPENAKFCFMCGKIALDNKQIALNDLEFIRSFENHIPNNSKEKFKEHLSSLENYIKFYGLR